MAFGESNAEYHNELYGYMERGGLLSEYKDGRETIEYIRFKKNGDKKREQITKSEYIRHQIHHPENIHNDFYKDEDLQSSIGDMRDFIQAQTE